MNKIQGHHITGILVRIYSQYTIKYSQKKVYSQLNKIGTQISWDVLGK